MSDLIDRQALKDAVKRYAGEPIKKKDRKCQAICLDMLGTIDTQPAASQWHRVEEPPKKTGKYVVCWTYQEKIYWDWLIFLDGKWELRAGLPMPDYWMPIEPPKEDAE